MKQAVVNRISVEQLACSRVLVTCPQLHPALTLFFCARIEANISHKQGKCSAIDLHL